MEHMTININIDYNPTTKELFIMEECSSGCTYQNVKPQEISEYVKNYTEIYVAMAVLGGEENEE